MVAKIIIRDVIGRIDWFGALCRESGTNGTPIIVIIMIGQDFMEGIIQLLSSAQS